MSSKFQILIRQFEQAVGKLSDALEQKKNEYIRDSSIQRFEVTFELAWKAIKAFLEEQGITAYSPRECMKGALKTGLIEDNPDWLRMIELRNLTSHTYNEEVAEEIYAALPGLLVLYKKLLAELKNAEQ